MRGIGVEAVNLEEFKTQVDRRGDDIFAELFTDHERQSCFLSRRSIASFAGFKAAKEALIKALPSIRRESEFGWRDMEVEVKSNGQMKFKLAGRLLEHLKRIDISTIHLSMTSTQDNAVAFVVVE